MKKLSSTLPNLILSLTTICLVVSGILALLNRVTSEPIRQAQIKSKIDAIRLVTPAFDNNPYEEQFAMLPEGETDSLLVYPAKKGGQPVGFAIESYTKKGFNGYISIMIGFDMQSQIVDYSVLKIEETPGLGSLIPDWFHRPSKNGGVQDIRGLDMKTNAPLSVSKDGGKVNAITAATISSRAFLDAVNRGYQTYLTAVSQSQSPQTK